jgi:hypothetical protein
MYATQISPIQAALMQGGYDGASAGSAGYGWWPQPAFATSLGVLTPMQPTLLPGFQPAVPPGPVGPLTGLAGLLPFAPDPLIPTALGGGPVEVGRRPEGLGVLLAADAAQPELQASREFLEDAARAIIEKLYGYLAQTVGQYPRLEETVRMVSRAADLLKQGDVGLAYLQAYQAYRSIAILRATIPALPMP